MEISILLIILVPNIGKFYIVRLMYDTLNVMDNACLCFIRKELVEFFSYEMFGSASYRLQTDVFSEWVIAMKQCRHWSKLYFVHRYRPTCLYLVVIFATKVHYIVFIILSYIYIIYSLRPLYCIYLFSQDKLRFLEF